MHIEVFHVQSPAALLAVRHTRKDGRYGAAIFYDRQWYRQASAELRGLLWEYASITLHAIEGSGDGEHVADVIDLQPRLDALRTQLEAGLIDEPGAVRARSRRRRRP